MAETDNNSVVETHIELDKQYIYEILKNTNKINEIAKINMKNILTIHAIAVII